MNRNLEFLEEQNMNQNFEKLTKTHKEVDTLYKEMEEEQLKNSFSKERISLLMSKAKKVCLFSRKVINPKLDEISTSLRSIDDLLKSRNKIHDKEKAKNYWYRSTISEKYRNYSIPSLNEIVDQDNNFSSNLTAFKKTVIGNSQGKEHGFLTE